MTKEDQRRFGRAARRALAPEQRERKNRCLRGRLAPCLPAAGIVLAYRACDGEPEVLPLPEGLTAAFPRTGANGTLEAVIPTRWEPGRFGIPEPAEGQLVPPGELAAVLVPLTAFDAAGNRLGRGGGYYDRYLPLCAAAKKIGIAYAEQRVERVVTEPHDVPMDRIIFA